MSEIKTTTRLVKKSEYDDKNHVIHTIFGDSLEIFNEYDDNENLILYKTISKKLDTVETVSYKYNENNNLIHIISTKRNIDLEVKYDKKGNEICSCLNGQTEYWRDYDERNNVIHTKFDDNGTISEIWYNYDETGRYIGSVTSDGYEYPNYNDIIDKSKAEDNSEPTFTEKDDRNNVIHQKDEYEEYWQEFDENNNIIHYKTNKGYESWYRYDDKNRTIWIKTNDDEDMDEPVEEFFEITFEYDDKNNMIHHTDSRGNEFKQYWNENNMPLKIEYILPIREDFVYTYDERGNTLEVNKVIYENEKASDEVNDTQKVYNV